MLQPRHVLEERLIVKEVSTIKERPPFYHEKRVFGEDLPQIKLSTCKIWRPKGGFAPVKLMHMWSKDHPKQAARVDSVVHVLLGLEA